MTSLVEIGGLNIRFTGERTVYFAETGGFKTTPVYSRYRLAPGEEVAGPAIIEEAESTDLSFQGPDLESLNQRQERGGDVRALVAGAWGFTSFNRLDDVDEMARAYEETVGDLDLIVTGPAAKEALARFVSFPRVQQVRGLAQPRQSSEVEHSHSIAHQFDLG